jgi:hypothetical protein
MLNDALVTHWMKALPQVWDDAMFFSLFLPT